MTESTDRRGADLVDRIAQLDARLADARRSRALRAAQAFAPDVAGIVLAEPEGLERALESYDPEFVSAAEITVRLSEGEPVFTDALLMNDGSVAADHERSTQIIELLANIEDPPRASTSEALPALSVEDALDRIGWSPRATSTPDERAHDLLMREEEAFGQRYESVRRDVMSSVPAVLLLRSEPTPEVGDGEWEALLSERDEVRGTLGQQTDAGVAFELLSWFPAADSFVSGRVEAKEVLVEASDAQGNLLYTVSGDSSCREFDVATGFRPRGVEVQLGEDVLLPSTGEPIRDGVRVSVSQTFAQMGESFTILDELIARGLLAPGWLARRGQDWRERTTARLSGTAGQWTEFNVTTFISLADGDFERAVADVLCEAAGVEPRPTYRIMSGNWFAAGVVPLRRDGRSIDLVIAERSDRDETWHPAVAVEAKFDAAVNGRVGYCTNPDHDSYYSNQLICYPMGCTHDQLNADDVSFVWLSPKRWPSHRDIPTALKQRDLVTHPRLAKALEEQERWAEKWKSATWSEVMSAVQERLAPYGPRVVEALERGISRD